MASYSTQTYANKVPAVGGHGIANPTTRLHVVSPTISTWATNDVINLGYIPRNAIVSGAGVKAASQLDSNGTPTLALDLGIVGTPQLFKAAITTVGRVSGVSMDSTIAAAAAMVSLVLCILVTRAVSARSASACRAASASVSDSQSSASSIASAGHRPA